ncbi:MAG: DUF2231 domain-containing protein [Candidatus Dormibacteraeota bacterium]|nr:DUF2231 domain-containing protein [Candidatus Dormibacteraeota bacterium]
MESKAKSFGHAIHPMLIVFPLGLLATSVVFDIVHLVSGRSEFATVAFWDIAAGVVGGLLAAVFGLWDWLALPGGTRAKVIGAWHGGGNVVVVALFVVSWLLRLGSPADPGIPPFVLSVVAVLLATVTGWLGGELVERLGVGVAQGANLNAPSSLSRAAGAPSGSRQISP